ncbi:MAG: hypothetical protein Q9171_002831 [Xanthocarpia ochracea]
MKEASKVMPPRPNILLIVIFDARRNNLRAVGVVTGVVTIPQVLRHIFHSVGNIPQHLSLGFETRHFSRTGGSDAHPFRPSDFFPLLFVNPVLLISPDVAHPVQGPEPLIVCDLFQLLARHICTPSGALCQPGRAFVVVFVREAERCARLGGHIFELMVELFLFVDEDGYLVVVFEDASEA